MNRIYQARASALQIFDLEKSPGPLTKVGSRKDPLWCHHSIFQDAINYYLVALGALSDSFSESRLIRDLRQRLRDSWEQSPTGAKDASSLRSSLRRTLPHLQADASLEDTFALILGGNTAVPGVRAAALSLLLSKCSGDAAIQQGGRGYLPRLCDPAYTGSWDMDSVAAASSSGKDLLANVLHSEADPAELEAIAQEMDLSWTIKLQPEGKIFQGEGARKRLEEALKHLLKQLDAPSARLAEALASISEDPRPVLLEHLKALKDLPEELVIRRNRKAAPDLTFATIAFKHFPGTVTQQFLKLGVKAPKTTAGKPINVPGSSVPALADDPVKLARGARGYVFPAFTSLPAWQPLSSGLPVWKEFDIAAFKEALKALNQFNQKTIEREKKLTQARQMLDYLIGKATEAPKSENPEEESTRLSPLEEQTWKRIQELEKELGENLNEGQWRLSTKSLRGFRDIVELWKKQPLADPARLQEIVKSYQADDKNRKEVGSVQLFLLLAEKRYHKLWQTAEKDSGDEEGKRSPASPLQVAVQVHRLEDEVERFGKPIRLTPADPRYSRRLFMFSDLKDKLAKVKFGSGDTRESGKHLDTAIAIREGGTIRETRVRIYFSAPRLDRDQLSGGTESRWLQPMTSALGLMPPHVTELKACSLMPDIDGDDHIRHLINLPVDLDTDWLHESLGKAAIWKNQFNGTKDHALHLHWPSTAKDATRKNAWWENPAIIRDGFTLLSNDLGQRSAGAWSLIKMTAWKPETQRPFHFIGSDGSREWFAELLQTGMYRLPGEDQKVLDNGRWVIEKSGKKGRPANAEEDATARILAEKLGCESIENWLGRPGERSFPELNDSLMKIANHRLTRLGTYHRWSCFDPEKLEGGEDRKQKVIAHQIAELESYRDDDVRAWLPLLEQGDFSRFRRDAGDAFENLRNKLEHQLTALANLAVPLRRKIWRWAEREPGPYGDLIQENLLGGSAKVRGQRGLSMPRLEQLEGLRRLFLRYNRSLDRSAGIPVKFGREDAGRMSGEPCRILLDKIDRMKEQRVNQTAHLILAQALGVRLKPHAENTDERARRDLHGEYEMIPGRQPVHFIVMEDLSRYLSSQGRAPSENSRLMKWAHRAIRDKLKMLAEEPFGIPLVEVIPAYSSRFDAKTGQPGSRLHELHSLAKYQHTNLEKLGKRSDKSPATRAAAATLLSQFRALEQANKTRHESAKPLRTLYYPQDGGPLFLSAKDGFPVQADMNAAANLGLRAIAAPDCLSILRRVRAKKDGDGYRARTDNAREKAAFGNSETIRMSAAPSGKFKEGYSPNFFYEPDHLAAFDEATLGSHRLVSGVALWSAVREAAFIRCISLNQKRLEKWNINPLPDPAEDFDPEDEIPM